MLQRFNHLLHRTKKVEFIEQFSEKLLVKQACAIVRLDIVGEAGMRMCMCLACVWHAHGMCVAWCMAWCTWLPYVQEGEDLPLTLTLAYVQEGEDLLYLLWLYLLCVGGRGPTLSILCAGGRGSADRRCAHLIDHTRA